AEPPIEPAPVSVPSDFKSFVELKGKTLSSLTPKERKAYAEEYNALKLGREEWAKEKQRAVEEAEKAPFNEPDILEKKITGKVTKPITATKRIKDILKDDRGSFSLKALKELDDVIENYKTKEKQPVSPEEYFGALGGYWGKVRKYMMHYITAMDKFGEKAEGVQHMIGRMDEDMGRLTKYYEELKPLFTANEKDVKTVLGKMMEWRKEEVKGIKTDAELSQLGWTPEQINLYKTVRHATRHHADDIRDVYLSRLEIEGYDIPRTVEESKRLLKTLKEDPNATPDMIDTAQLAYNINRLADTMKEMHYVPASRFGKYYVVVKDEKGEVQRLEMFDKKKQADARTMELWNEIKSEGKDRWTVHSDKNVKPLLASTYQLTPSTMIFTKHVLEQMKKSGKLSGALEDIYHDLDRITAKWGNKFPTHLLKADMIPGWSEDYARSFASYIRGLSSFIAHVKYDPKIRNAIAKLDPIKDRELIDWMNKKYEFMNSSSTVTSVINRGLFMYYLAGNPKSAIVNTLQHLNSVAYSTKWLSPTEAMRTHVKASKYTYDYLMNKKESIPKDMLEVLEDMSRKERISAQAIQTLADISSGKGIRTNKVMEALSFGFKKAEEFNRAHATITAFEIGKKLGLKGEKMTAFIERFINDTQYDYTKLGVPLLAQHPAIRPLWAFRTFTYNWLRVMKNLLGEGHYGTFVAMLTPLFMLGGLTGLPLAPEMLSAIKSTTGFDFHTWLKEKEKQIGDENGTLSDSIMFGLGGLGGMSLGASLNPVELPNVGVRHTLEEAALQAGLGAPGSLYWRAKRAYQMLDRYGDTYRAVENMMPEFIRNLMVTYRWYKEKGARAASGEPYYENISPRDLIFRSFGIQPVKYIEGLEKVERMKELMESAKSDVAKVNLLIAKQVFRMMGGNENEQKDAEEKIQNIIENLMAKNAEYAEKGEYSKIIVPDERAIRMNVLKMANPDAYYLTMSPERARPEMAQMLDAWGSALNLGEEEVAEAINDEVETYGMRELLKLAGQSTEEE
ncbi:MAG TPA: PLxRFG domain-containing protein, partial [Rectinema sp.]|nr:PLxRFG domain-containing protein [Rectinema sp.]